MPRRRASTAFGTRKAGLKNKAWELSVLCDVDVALVVADADAGGAAAAAEVWESREGVIARYRALGPAARARHARRGYVEAELGKEEAKLARVRQGGPDGLARHDRVLDGVATERDARWLLEDIDAAIRAAEERRRALGMPAGGHGNDGGAGAGAGLALQAGIAPGVGADDQWPGGHGDAAGQVVWGENGGFFQPCGAADTQPAGGYGFPFQQCSTSGGAGMEGYYHLQMAPAMYGSNSYSDNGHLADAYHAGTMQHGYGVEYAGASGHPNLAMWSADEPRDAMVPVDYYPTADTGLNYNYMDDTPAANAFQGGGGGRSVATGATGNFIDSPSELSLAMGTGGGGNLVNAPAMGGTGENFTIATPIQPLAMNSSYYGGNNLTNAGGYAAAWQAAPQPQRDGSGGQQPLEQLHYLSDLEDTQLNLWRN